MKETKQVPWTGEPNQRAINYLNEEGKVIVCPTKVGYIIAVSDKKGWNASFQQRIASVTNQASFFAAHWNSYMN